MVWGDMTRRGPFGRGGGGGGPSVDPSSPEGFIASLPAGLNVSQDGNRIYVFDPTGIAPAQTYSIKDTPGGEIVVPASEARDLEFDVDANGTLIGIDPTTGEVVSRLPGFDLPAGGGGGGGASAPTRMELISDPLTGEGILFNPVTGTFTPTGQRVEIPDAYDPQIKLDERRVELAERQSKIDELADARNEIFRRAELLEQSETNRAGLKESQRANDMNAALRQFETMTQRVLQLGQLAQDESRRVQEILSSADDFVARAFESRGEKSPLAKVTQADQINALRSAMDDLRAALPEAPTLPTGAPLPAMPTFAELFLGGVPGGAPAAGDGGGGGGMDDLPAIPARGGFAAGGGGGGGGGVASGGGGGFGAVAQTAGGRAKEMTQAAVNAAKAGSGGMEAITPATGAESPDFRMALGEVAQGTPYAPASPAGFQTVMGLPTAEGPITPAAVPFRPGATSMPVREGASSMPLPFRRGDSGPNTYIRSISPNDYPDFGFVGYAMGGVTREPVMRVGEEPSGASNETTEIVVNPTRAPIGIVPGEQVREQMPGYATGTANFGPIPIRGVGPHQAGSLPGGGGYYRNPDGGMGTTGDVDPTGQFIYLQNIAKHDPEQAASAAGFGSLVDARSAAARATGMGGASPTPGTPRVTQRELVDTARQTLAPAARDVLAGGMPKPVEALRGTVDPDERLRTLTARQLSALDDDELAALGTFTRLAFNAPMDYLLRRTQRQYGPSQQARQGFLAAAGI